MKLSLTVLALLACSSADARIELIPVTIEEGKIAFPAQFTVNEERASKAGINLADHLQKYSVSGEANGKVFLLFYNDAAAPDCDRDYLIQRVKLTKAEFDQSGMETSRKEQYLVEVMKIKNGRTKKPDEHLKLYSVGAADRRHLSAEYEIGCGEIPGNVEGQAWPREPNKLYWLVQDYADTPGHYFNVRFSDSASYRFEMDHDARGILNVSMPAFVSR